MRLCHYVILDHCQSELSQVCAPLFVLLEFYRGTTKSSIRIFSDSNVRELLRKMPRQRQSWILGMLSDLRDECRDSRKSNHNMLDQFYSLGVGPLRTSVSGSIHIDADDNPLEIISSQVEDMNPQQYQGNSISSLRGFAEIPDGLAEQEQVEPNAAGST